MKKMMMMLFALSCLTAQAASASCVYGKIIPVSEEGNFLVSGSSRNPVVIGAVISDLTDIPLNKAAYFEYEYVESTDEGTVLISVKRVSSCRGR